MALSDADWPPSLKYSRDLSAAAATLDLSPFGLPFVSGEVYKCGHLFAVVNIIFCFSFSLGGRRDFRTLRAVCPPAAQYHPLVIRPSCFTILFPAR